MKKPDKKDFPHIVLFGSAWLLFAGCLIRFLAVYGSLPDEIGVHFGGGGSFDVVDKKIYGFYPFVISLITLVICGVLSKLVNKASAGNNMTERGTSLSRFAVKLFIDIFQLSLVFSLAGMWSDAVIRQQPLDTTVPVVLILTVFGLLFALIIFLTAVKFICREKK